MFREGGNLLLGCYYAESPTIYFGLNPGSWGPAMDFVPNFDGKSGRNPPFECTDDYAGKSYGRNWRRLLSVHPDLRTWFNDKVTSANLCPWRTGNARKLRTLNKLTGERIYCYSSQLVWRMIEHHKANLSYSSRFDICSPIQCVSGENSLEVRG